MTELSFLIDLLLNHKLPKPTRDALAERIKVVEGLMPFKPTQMQPAPAPVQFQQQPQLGSQPWASTRAAMAKHESPGLVDPVIGPSAASAPVTIAHTAATAIAMQSRNQAIAESIAGKVDKVTGRPRKF